MSMRRTLVLAAACVACNSTSSVRGDGGQTGTGDGSDSTDSDDGSPEVVDCIEVPDDGSMFGPGEPGPLGLFNARCDPRRDESVGPYRCCSDDPAAAEGRLPDYAGRGIDGAAPIFSGPGNNQGTQGACVRVDVVADGLAEPEAAGCPVPCNPTWTDADVALVCGTGRSCCQTLELEPEDCIVVDGRRRPATGADIDEHTSWAFFSHATHQDPNGTGCLALSGGMMNDAFFDCVGQLTVADQRGFCMPAGSCLVDPDYVDACTAAGG